MFNSRKLKKTFLIALLILLIVLPTFVIGIVTPTKDFYVNDYSKVLTEETKNYIMNINIELQRKTGAQVVVVTVPTLEGKSIEEYATELFRNFGIGSAEKNNGVLLLCSEGDRLFRIEVGYGLEGILTDGKTGRIQDEYIIPYLKDNNYDEGIKNGFSAVIQEICKEYDISLSNTIEAKGIEPSYKIEDDVVLLRFIIISFFIVSFLSLIKLKIINIIYIVISPIIYYLIKNNIDSTLILFVLNIVFAVAVHFRWFSLDGGSSGRGGSSGGYSGGRRFFWWRRK